MIYDVSDLIHIRIIDRKNPGERRRPVDYYRRAIINGEELTQPHFRSGRDLFLYSGLLIKIDDGLQSDNEIRLWEAMDDEDRQWFAAICGHGKTECGREWVAQHFLISDQIYLGDSFTFAFPEWVFTKIAEMIDKYNIGDISKNDPFNWGIFRGQPKIYDYGYNHYYRK